MERDRGPRLASAGAGGAKQRAKTSGISTARETSPIAPPAGASQDLDATTQGAYAEHQREGSAFWSDPPWWFREGLLALVVAGVIGVCTVTVQKDIDDQRSDREAAAAKLLAEQTDEAARRQAELAQRLENQRFVRERSAKEIRDRPFQDLDLTELSLSGLSLRGADFRMAKMKSTTLRDSDLRGADFAFADMNTRTDFNSSDLTGAAIVRVGGGIDPMVGNFFNSELISAKLIGVTFTDLGPADLSGAMLQYADLSRVDLSAAKLDGACYNESTSWPQDFTPPPSGDPNTCELNHLRAFFSARNEPIPDYYFQPIGSIPRP